MKNNKDNIRCFKFFGKFAWQNDKKYYAFLVLSIIVNSLSPFVTILGTQYLIDEIADVYVKYAFPACREAKIALAELGNDAGIYGAAALIV